MAPLDGDAYWNEWNAMGISTGYGDGFNDGVANGFLFNGTSLVANVDDFGGFLACNWARGVPQLFWYFAYADPAAFPSNCAVVDLVKVPA